MADIKFTDNDDGTTNDGFFASNYTPDTYYWNNAKFLKSIESWGMGNILSTQIIFRWKMI